LKSFSTFLLKELAPSPQAEWGSSIPTKRKRLKSEDGRESQELKKWDLDCEGKKTLPLDSESSSSSLLLSLIHQIFLECPLSNPNFDDHSTAASFLHTITLLEKWLILMLSLMTDFDDDDYLSLMISRLRMIEVIQSLYHFILSSEVSILLQHTFILSLLLRLFSYLMTKQAFSSYSFQTTENSVCLKLSYSLLRKIRIIFLLDYTSSDSLRSPSLLSILSSFVSITLSVITSSQGVSLIQYAISANSLSQNALSPLGVEVGDWNMSECLSIFADIIILGVDSIANCSHDLHLDSLDCSVHLPDSTRSIPATLFGPTVDSLSSHSQTSSSTPPSCCWHLVSLCEQTVFLLVRLSKKNLLCLRDNDQKDEFVRALSVLSSRPLPGWMGHLMCLANSLAEEEPLLRDAHAGSQ
jgi:hypothetical protein